MTTNEPSAPRPEDDVADEPETAEHWLDRMAGQLDALDTVQMKQSAIPWMIHMLRRAEVLVARQAAENAELRAERERMAERVAHLESVPVVLTATAIAEYEKVRSQRDILAAELARLKRDGCYPAPRIDGGSTVPPASPQEPGSETP